jgi:hypothetical protein
MSVKVKKIAVVLLGLICLISAAQSWRSSIGLDLGSEALADWEARLEPVKDALPIERGVIGYIGEWDVPGIEYSYWDQEGEYLLAQYALAPLILVKGPHAGWNVAVLSPQAFSAWSATHEGQYEVQHIRQNVYVLHKLNNP